MCKAFSCIIHRNKKVYWKLGIDSHNNIFDHYKLNSDNKKREYCQIEITPKNNNYVNPDEWVFKFDDGCPDLWKQGHEKACFNAKDVWYKQVRSKLYIKRLNNIINPFELPKVKTPLKKHIKLLKEWDSLWYSVWNSVVDSVRDSVGNSVGNSVRDSVGNSVGNSVRDSVVGSVRYSVWNSVRDSVWNSVRDSVWNSVWDSLYGYVGFHFKIPRTKWKYTEKIKTKGYPFLSVVKLWQDGIVPSFDGTYWRLHSGKNADVIFKISKEDLMNNK